MESWLTSSVEDRESFSFPDDMGCTEVSSSCSNEIDNLSILETVFSGNLSSFLKGVKPLVLYDEDRGMLMEPMQGKLASSHFYLGNTDLFCVPEVTSVFFSSCDSVFGDSLEFNQVNRSSLCVQLGKRNCSACNAGESGLISWLGGSLIGFLELRQAPGVYSRVTTGMPILNGSLFSEVRTPVWV